MAELEPVSEETLKIRQSIIEQLKERELEIPSEYKEVFEHHLDVLIYRLQNNECINYEDSAVEDQVSPEDLSMAKDILVPLFAQYKVPENKMEEVLLAIYIQLAKGERKI